MKWKSQSTDEVGKEHDPLVGSQRRNDLPCVWQPVRDICDLATRSFVICSSLTVEATHLPPAPDMFGYAEKV